MLKNIFKLSFANFKEVWKLLLYRTIYFLIAFGLTTVASWNIINTLIKENFFVNLQTNIKDLAFSIDFSKIFNAISATFKDFANIVSANGLVAQSIIGLVLIVLLCSYFEVLGRFAIYSTINGYMNSMVQYGYVNMLVSGFGKATLYALVFMITELPVTLAICVGAYIFASKMFAVLGAWSIFLAVVLLILFMALKKMFFGGWLPAYVVNGKAVFKSLANGMKAFFKNFGKIYLNYLLFITLAVIFIAFSITFTVGVGLVIVMPLFTLEKTIVSQVGYYEAYGMRYYVDSNEVITPTRLEQKDTFKKVKDII